MLKAWFGVEVMNYVRSAMWLLLYQIGELKCGFVFVTRISLVFRAFVASVCMSHAPHFCFLFYRWPWQTAPLQTEPVKTRTPSLTAERPTLTWLIWEPSHGSCSQVRLEEQRHENNIHEWKPLHTSAVAHLHIYTMTWQTADALCSNNIFSIL